MASLLSDLLQDDSDLEDAIAKQYEHDSQASGNEDESMDDEDGDDDGDHSRELTDGEEINEKSLLRAAAAGQSVLADAENETEAKARIQKVSFRGMHDVQSVAGLVKSLRPLLKQVESFGSSPAKSRVGSVENDPEYKLLIDANYHASLIANETVLVNKFIKDHYSRYPELENILQNPLEYAKTVAILGNFEDAQDLDQRIHSSDNLVGQTLKQVLDGPSLMAIRLGIVQTTGAKMSDGQVETVNKACEMTFDLEKAKQTLTAYVESRMTKFAPSLTRLISSKTAALLVNTAGGLSKLAQTPACNVPALGAKKHFFGLATNTRGPKQGYLYQAPIIQEVPLDLRKQALRIVSAKLILAARCDSVETRPDGATGERLRQECLDRLEKLTAPAPNKGPRALPVPDDKPSRKRGGRRARKAKEQYAMTDLRKAQNRLAFGKEEAEVNLGDETEGLGMVGSAVTGQVRATQVDQRTKAKLSKKSRGWGFESANGTSIGIASSIKGMGGNTTVLSGHHHHRSSGGATVAGSATAANATSGTVSTINFSASQGLELINPKAKEEMERKRKAEQDGWFKSGTFTQLGAASTIPTTGTLVPRTDTGKVDTAGFQIPALPAIKRLKQGL